MAAFLDTKHKDRYKLYNLCSERTYDVSHFHNRVERVMIDDHNVPSVKQMLEFADNVRDWLAQHQENVIVVHCKGETLYKQLIPDEKFTYHFNVQAAKGGRGP